MKVKKIKVGIKSIEDVLEDTANVMKKLERGEKVKKETAIYFTSLEVFRKALTPKSLELLHIIKKEKPSSINELARVSGRNIKNVSDDLKFLEQAGFVVIEAGKRTSMPVVKYDRINLEIAV